jgi:hypothetical protein
MTFLYIVGALFGLFVLFIIWRLLSVPMGAKKRDAKITQLLDPALRKLQSGEGVSREEVEQLATHPHARPMLYKMLEHFEYTHVFPEKYLDRTSQAQAELCHWMLHPNELQDVPEAIELLETITKPIPEKGDGEYLVFKYKMPAGHWAEKDGWLLGVAGPYLADDKPFAGIATAFSRCSDKLGEAKPEDLVDWFYGMYFRSQESADKK